MERSLIVETLLLLASPPAFAATASGNGALSLAALVAEHSHVATRTEKALLNAYLDGRAGARFPEGGSFAVKADEVTCRISDVDITHKDCRLVFGKRTVSLAGRRAHELYATLMEVGVPSGGAAGSIYESLKSLECRIDPAEVQQRGGGGASCAFVKSIGGLNQQFVQAWTKSKGVRSRGSKVPELSGAVTSRYRERK